MQDETKQYGYDMASTVPSRVASIALRDFYPNGLSRMLQPYFGMYCWHTDSSPDLTEDNHYVYFGPGKDYLDNLIPLTRLSPSSDNNKTGESEYLTFPGIDDPGFGTAPPIFVSFHNLPEHISNDTALMVVYSNDSGMDSCEISAHWIEAATNITAGITNVDEDFRQLESRSHETQAIKISLKWLAHAVISGAASFTRLQIEAFYPSSSLILVVPLALAALPSSNSSKSYIDFSPGGTMTSGDSDSTTAKQDSDVIAYCTRQGYWQKYEGVRLYGDTGNWTDPASLVQYAIQGLSAGYGYDAKTSTVRLSLAVIMFYVCLATVYLSYSVITGHTASSWNSIAEVVALALNSERPDVLKNTSVGIKTLETFRQPVYVRINEHSSLELVFGDGKEEVVSGYREVVPNEKY